MDLIKDAGHEACNLCGSNKAEPVLATSDIRLVRCRNCGLIFANPMRTEEEEQEIYSSKEYRKKEIKIANARVPIFREGARSIESRKAGGELLDVGCATGLF